MPEIKPSPQQTLAVLLGASSFRHASSLAQGRAFYKSAEDFRDYLIAEDGLGLPCDNLNWLFDDSRSPSDQLQDIGSFLERRSAELKNGGTPPKDLIVFYVGHGLFSESDQAYCLAIRGLDERSKGLTSIRVSDLASIIKSQARFLRKFLILDCCFSAAAYKEFQSGPIQAGRVKLLDEFPRRGTTLLCSSSAQDVSVAPEGLAHTMFSDSLLRSLRQGCPTLGPRISLNELGDLVKENLRGAYPDNWVRPEVDSPDQREGDVASTPLFPNAAYVLQKDAEEAQRKAEAERVAAETAAWERADSERKAKRDAEEVRQTAGVERAAARAKAQQREEAEQEARKQARQRQIERDRAEQAREKFEAERSLKEKADAEETTRERASAVAQPALADLIGAKEAPIDWRKAAIFFLANLTGPFITFTWYWANVPTKEKLWIVLDVMIFTGCTVGALRSVQRPLWALAVASGSRSLLALGLWVLFGYDQISVSLVGLQWIACAFLFLVALELSLRHIEWLWLALFIGAEVRFLFLSLITEYVGGAFVPNLLGYRTGVPLTHSLGWFLDPAVFATVFWFGLLLLKKRDENYKSAITGLDLR